MIYTMLNPDWLGQTNKLFAFLATITLSFRKGNKEMINMKNKLIEGFQHFILNK
jgi:hypothetical protein